MKRWFFYITLSGTLLLPAMLSAQSGPGGEPVDDPTSFDTGMRKLYEFAYDQGISINSNITLVISNIIQWLLALSALFALGALVWGGITYILSLGDEKKAEKAKSIVKYAIIGVIVVLLSFVIITFIQTLLV